MSRTSTNPRRLPATTGNRWVNPSSAFRTSFAAWKLLPWLATPPTITPTPACTHPTLSYCFCLIPATILSITRIHANIDGQCRDRFVSKSRKHRYKSDLRKFGRSVGVRAAPLVSHMSLHWLSGALQQFVQVGAWNSWGTRMRGLAPGDGLIEN